MLLLGCEFLHTAITQNKPKYHIFGHCHVHGGTSTQIGKTTFINVATTKYAMSF
jgi:Icc-related predicted phosphoesterase